MPISKGLIPNSMLCLIPKVLLQCPISVHFMSNSKGLPTLIPNNFSFMKYAGKSVPDLADVGVPHGDGDGPVTPAPGSESKKCPYHVDQREKLNQ